MKPTAFDGQVVNIAESSHPAEALGNRPTVNSAGDPATGLRQRIAATVNAARAQRESELQQASDRANAERREIQQKAKNALLMLLSDDVINSIIGKHAGLGELYVGTIQVTKRGVELIRSGGAGASHMMGDRLDLRFDGGILQAGQQLKSLAFPSRVLELQTHGIRVDGVHDASAQAILITFDYENAVG